MILYSVILPCYNEEKSLYRSLSSLLENFSDKDFVETEFIVVDGCSSDRTYDEYEKLIGDYPKASVKFLLNINRTVPFGLNMGIKAATGEFIIRIDSHSIYPINYIQDLVYYLHQLDASNVGGIVDTVPYELSNLKSLAISYCMSHKFGVGNSYFRVGSKNIVEVDTVPFGCFRKSIFDEVGFFDEELTRNQDDEFNGRLKNHSKKIFLIPDIKIKYFGRSNFTQLFTLFYQYGLFKPYVNIKLKKPATIRQFFPPLFVLYMFTIIFLLIVDVKNLIMLPVLIYFILLLVSSFSFNLGVTSIVYRITAFFIIHLSYGLGYWNGLINIYLLNKKKINNKIKISR